MEKSLDEVDKRRPARARPARSSPTTSSCPGYCAWYAAAQRPGPGRGLDAWARIAARALKARGEEVPYDRESRAAPRSPPRS